MTNYTQTTFFTPKDTLPATDPNKTIFGAAYDVEFGNIATAIASKPDATTVASFLNVNVTGNGLPANGLYLPSTNVLGFATNTVLRMSLAANGGLFMAGATGGTQGAGTINATGLFVNGVAVVAGGTSSSSGTFTATYTGMTAVITVTAKYAQVGNAVTIFFPNNVGVSNASTFTATGLPGALVPVSGQELAIPVYSLADNGATITTGSVLIDNSGIFAFKIRSVDWNGWTASGNKGVNIGFAVTYLLN